jgi:hypothetical protein
MVKHSLIFIHGMGTGEPEDSYKELWQFLAGHYERIYDLPKGTFEERFQQICINYKDVTYEAKKDIFESAFPKLGTYEPTQWDVLNPIRPLRYFITFFLGDANSKLKCNSF